MPIDRGIQRSCDARNQIRHQHAMKPEVLSFFHQPSCTWSHLVIDRRSGHLHPLNLCLGEARAAAAIGVQIFEGSPVTALGTSRMSYR